MTTYTTQSKNSTSYSAQSQTLPTTSGLIAHFLLNEDDPTTNVYDNSGTQSTATSSRATQDMSIPGHVYKAFDFNGSDDYVNIPHKADQLLTSGFTLSVWIKPDSSGENSAGRIINKTNGTTSQDGFSLQMFADSALNFNINSGTSVQSAASSISSGNGIWYHAVVTVTADALVTFYINGAVSGTPSTTGALSGITTTNDMRIGNRSGATDRAFDGGIDDVRIYNTVLTADQILTIYNSGWANVQQT